MFKFLKVSMNIINVVMEDRKKEEIKIFKDKKYNIWDRYFFELD